MKYVILDLETIASEVPVEPRSSELARMLKSSFKAYENHPGELNSRVGHFVNAMLEAQEPTFPQVACWRIVCGAVVMLSREGIVEKMGLVHGETEEEQVEHLAALLLEKDTRLVTWNGRRFDVPIIEARCLHYGLPLTGFERAWRYRYNDEAHYDLKDYLAAYGSVGSSMSLDQASLLIGLPGKPDGVDGSQVADMVKGGELEKVRSYCLSDAVQTAGVLIRAEMMRGRLTVSQGREACVKLLDKCSEDERVRWIADKTNRKTFCLEKQA